MRNYVLIGLLVLFCLWTGWFVSKMEDQLSQAYYDITGFEPPPTSGDPKWSHAFNLTVRAADEPKVTDSTARYGIEVFRDTTNGNLIYITDTGSIAVVPD